jgi:hypothetical protein
MVLLHVPRRWTPGHRPKIEQSACRVAVARPSAFDGVGSIRTRWRLGLLVQQRSLLDETIDADITRSTANSTTPTLPEIRSATGANPSTGRCRPSRCGPAWAVSVRPTGAMIERFHLERCSMKCQILLLAVLVMSAQAGAQDKAPSGAGDEPTPVATASMDPRAVAGLARGDGLSERRSSARRKAWS